MASRRAKKRGLSNRERILLRRASNSLRNLLVQLKIKEEHRGCFTCQYPGIYTMGNPCRTTICKRYEEAVFALNRQQEEFIGLLDTTTIDMLELFRETDNNPFFELLKDRNAERVAWNLTRKG